ncbi:MAG: hypothetical protein JGK29_32945 [Microcoleus sp. PH2017_17_BER_D_A]|nr:hypothetical protein [Microcoleus sp. PH2017_17_BER_D_A]
MIELCENWHSEYVSDKELDLVRFPARLFPHFGRKLSVWLLARRFDISRWSHGGKSKGSGIGKFSLAAASKILDRSQGHIRKLLCVGKRSGLGHSLLCKLGKSDRSHRDRETRPDRRHKY